ncbi:hypothetical protein GCM10007385_22940 [Tateyamaria omphalii]|nr:hypothetical protein GCM10007385_22940 [Tateyamaria omphalii]
MKRAFVMVCPLLNALGLLPVEKQNGGAIGQVWGQWKHFSEKFKDPDAQLWRVWKACVCCLIDA